ncbi:hypothetical protein WAI453_003669 [Rhynchosporium graminicola]
MHDSTTVFSSNDASIDGDIGDPLLDPTLDAMINPRAPLPGHCIAKLLEGENPDSDSWASRKRFDEENSKERRKDLGIR